jgi:hypothetical protein
MIPLSLLRKIDRWVIDHALVWCIQCRRMMWAKDAHYRSTTTGIVGTLCEDCERELYHPWRK